MVSFEQILYGHPNLECLFLHQQHGRVLFVYVVGLKNGGNETKPQSYVEETDEVGSGRTDIIFHHVYLGSTQRECKSNEYIVEQNTKKYESK